MKVFEVITEKLEEDNKVTEIRQYVTSDSDTMLSVAEHFSVYCEEYEEDLKSIREVAVITQNIAN